MKLEIKNLTFKYKDQEIIKDLSLKIINKNFCSIIGQNQSGKSTLGKLIACLEKADSGSILLNNLEIKQEDVAIVFQNPQDQIVHFKVIDELAFVLENKNINKDDILKEINYYADLFKIKHLLNSFTFELSGGELQKIEIISSLFQKPRLLILDEATEMLDEAIKLDVINILKDYAHTKDCLILLITHDMNIAIESEHTILIDDGKVKAEGNYIQIFKQEKLLTDMKLEVPYIMRISKDCNLQFQTLKDFERYICQLKQKN